MALNKVKVRYAPKAGATLVAPELKAGAEVEATSARAAELVASGAFELVADKPPKPPRAGAEERD